MNKHIRCLGRIVVVGMVLTVLQMGSSAWAGGQGHHQPKLKVGMLLTLEGVDALGASHEENFWVAGRAFLPFTEGRHFQVMEHFGDDDVGMWIGKWDRQGNYHFYSSGSEITTFLNGPVGTTFQYGDIEGEVVSVGETVTVPAGTFYDCVQVEKHDIDGSPPWIEWWKPGFFIVKWTDWWVPEDAPVEWELVSVERMRP